MVFYTLSCANIHYENGFLNSKFMSITFSLFAVLCRSERQPPSVPHLVCSCWCSWAGEYQEFAGCAHRISTYVTLASLCVQTRRRHGMKAPMLGLGSLLKSAITHDNMMSPFKRPEGEDGCAISTAPTAGT